jgi:hypothetical protein
MLKSLAVATAIAFFAVPAVAQDGDALIAELFTAFEAEFPNLSTVQRHNAGLAAGATSRFTFNARAGVEYTVVGLCDENCTDVDLEVFSGSTSVGSDFLEDDVPIVVFTAERAGSYTVEITMATCSARNCRAGAKAYAG